ncbi:MAG: hypothetical protein J6574_03885 [Gilliamella sp.]|nr:hypothetical protein [Gilliamella sp.]
MNNETQNTLQNDLHNFSKSSFSNTKMDKSVELNPSMTIAPVSPDELTVKLRGGDFIGQS